MSTVGEMIYPDVPIERWVKRYPALAECLPVCDCENPELRSYRTHRSAGIECTVCSASAWTGATAESKARNLNLVSPLIGEEHV